jgi:predicted nucleotidyltransferase component of viral defense system
MKNQLHPQTLPSATKKIVKIIQETKPSWLDDFYLSGGTALSLQLGHRESEDLDFFNQHNFDPRKLQPQIEKLGKLESLELSENTLNTFVNEVKLQFLGYPYKLLEPTANYQGIKLSSVVDIACTKIQTVGMRGSKKDFIDVYFILQQFSLEELFLQTEKKYQDSEFNKIHILKSMIYFNDAEDQPMPRMHKEVSWGKIKKELISVVTNFKI